ncbi:MAG: toxin-antitoxin system, antitoxin component [bacterium]
MPQLTIYLDAKAGRLIERAAKLEDLSLSRWAREKLVLAAGAPDWPTGYDSVLGSIRDPSFMIPSEADPSGDQEANFSS